MYWLSKKKYIIGLTLPTIIMYTGFIIMPIFIAIGYSFTKYSGIGQPKFNGLSNYLRLFGDDVFWVSLKNTLIIFGCAFVLLLIGGFFAALLLNSKFKGNDIAKSLIYSPAIIAPIIVGIIWVYILDPSVGILNAILRGIGVENPPLWIGGQTLSPFSIAFIYFWQQLGYIMTIYIAGLKMIPDTVLEAAQIDGATFWQKIRYVTMPMLRGTISKVAVLLITGTFKIFEIVQFTTGGGPNHMSETLVTYSYSTTFTNREYGYGMSLATITFFVSLLITGIYLFATRRKEL